MNPLIESIRVFSKRARQKRAAIFRNSFSLDCDTKILDIGSDDGLNIKATLEGTTVQPRNVYIADINQQSVTKGSREFGFTPVLIAESGALPFPDRFFDVVYCSSVIEHVTIPKERVWQLSSGRKFRHESRRRQKAFADEIVRVGKCYFVQTPNRHFPIESHTWLPFVAWLPRRLLIPTLRVTNLFWVKTTNPNWCLLDKNELSELFDEARIMEEKAFGLTKSIMAVSKTPAPVVAAPQVRTAGCPPGSLRVGQGMRAA
jgi:SAM-dependent methyltransferase